jgi:Flp pilus assembly protein TadG
MSVFSRFGRDIRGNVAMMFGLALVPLVGMVGAAVDYSRIRPSTTGCRRISATSRTGNSSR